jgi:hypothetical protein
VLCCLLPAVCCLLSAVCCLLSAVCCLLSAVCCLLSAVCRLLSAVCRLPSAVCCLLSAVCCLLSAICYLLCTSCWRIMKPCKQKAWRTHPTLSYTTVCPICLECHFSNFTPRHLCLPLSHLRFPSCLCSHDGARKRKVITKASKILKKCRKLYKRKPNLSTRVYLEWISERSSKQHFVEGKKCLLMSVHR